jgi:gallate decarboxylase subunit D
MTGSHAGGEVGMDRVRERQRTMTGDLASFTVRESQGNLEVSAQVVPMGGDVLVILYGGIVHIGAVAMGSPRPSLSDPRTVSATSSVFSFLGHMEDRVAKPMAEELAKKLDKKTVVVAGIHWADLSVEEIGTVLELCERLQYKVIEEALKG